MARTQGRKARCNPTGSRWKLTLLLYVALHSVAGIPTARAISSGFRLQFQSRAYRSGDNFQRDPAQVKTIYNTHVRKSGGSSVNHILWFYAKRYDREFNEFQGTPKVMQLQHEKDNETASVITLRHPVDRICSMYEFDFVNNFNRNIHTPAWQLRNGHGIGGYWKERPHLENNTHAAEAWADYLDAHRHVSEKYGRQSQWDSISNVFVKTLSGWDTEPTDSGLRYGVTWKDFVMAVKVLETYDVVLLTQHLQSAGAKCMLDAVLGPINQEIAHANAREQHDQDGPKKPSCLSQVPRDIVEELRELNRYDIMLFEHAIDLVQFRLLELGCPADMDDDGKTIAHDMQP